MSECAQGHRGQAKEYFPKLPVFLVALQPTRELSAADYELAVSLAVLPERGFQVSSLQGDRTRAETRRFKNTRTLDHYVHLSTGPSWEES